MGIDSQVSSEGPHSATWFVGAVFRGRGDQVERFLSEGIWENGYDDRLQGEVLSMREGDRIAIKSCYTRKNGLPFDNRKISVSVLAIKAIGTITENFGDGKRVRVEWEKVEPIKEWYFYTFRATIWRVVPRDWMSESLIAFAFEKVPQDIYRFRNSPYWRDRYGDTPGIESRFLWTAFYEEVAEKLLKYSEDRAPLIAAIHEIGKRVPKFQVLQDKFPDGSTGPLQDICPFTAMGIFNRTMTDKNRQIIAAELAKFLGVSEPVPRSMGGIPLLNNQRSWYFGYANTRKPRDIDTLWEVFIAASKSVGSDSPDDLEAFIDAYDRALEVWGVAWNLSTGLFWAHPNEFPTLDGPSREFIQNRLGLRVIRQGRTGPPSGQDYVELADSLKKQFEENECPVRSFPELSWAAWKDNPSDGLECPSEGDPDQQSEEDAHENHLELIVTKPGPLVPYSLDDILADGCFLSRPEIESLIGRLNSKKNLILQGPPGTGKTWLGRRLAYALIGEKDDSKVRVVQFHPNLSYEDFVRGWRPSGEGKLTLSDGIFMEMIKKAIRDQGSNYVIVIEEINRGNPAQIFGELLTLLEASKRLESEQLELCYPDADGQRRPVYIPPNLYVVGTMNVADRSLALVDIALRRRFAFVDLEPNLNPSWKKWVVERCSLDPQLVEEIEGRVRQLNEQITNDIRLGKQFRIGHSYLTPAHPIQSEGTGEWFKEVVETEIGPLLDEYWFDSPDVAGKATAKLKQGW